MLHLTELFVGLGRCLCFPNISSYFRAAICSRKHIAEIPHTSTLEIWVAKQSIEPSTREGCRQIGIIHGQSDTVPLNEKLDTGHRKYCRTGKKFIFSSDQRKSQDLSIPVTPYSGRWSMEGVAMLENAQFLVKSRRYYGFFFVIRHCKEYHKVHTLFFKKYMFY